MDIRYIGTRCLLGESPTWDPIRELLYYVDVNGRELFQYDPRRDASVKWSLDGLPGGLALRRNGNVMIALGQQLQEFDPGKGAVVHAYDLQGADEDSRLNDGKTDRAGRFLVGALDNDMMRDRGGLFSFDRSHETGRVLVSGGFGCVNGPCWSPDYTTLYVSDSMKKTIFAYDYLIETGDIGTARPLIDTSSLGGMPDGATVDSDGLLWVAIVMSGTLACFRPDGKLERKVEVPTPWVSSLTFGGWELDRLFVTSIDPSVAGQPTGPHCGYTMIIDGLGARGLPQPFFGEDCTAAA